MKYLGKKVRLRKLQIAAALGLKKIIKKRLSNSIIMTDMMYLDCLVFQIKTFFQIIMI